MCVHSHAVIFLICLRVGYKTVLLSLRTSVCISQKQGRSLLLESWHTYQNQKLAWLQFYHLIYKSFSNVSNCPTNVLYCERRKLFCPEPNTCLLSLLLPGTSQSFFVVNGLDIFAEDRPMSLWNILQVGFVWCLLMIRFRFCVSREGMRGEWQ